MCCTRLAENTGHKNSPSAHHHTTLSCHVFATKAYIDSRKNNWLNSNISSTSFHSMTNFGPLTTEIGWRVWASQQISTYFPTSLNGGQPKFARCLAVSWDDVPCIHFKFFLGGGLFPPNGILPGAKFTLRPSLAFSYVVSVTARRSSSGRGGHHVGHRPRI